MIRSLVVLGALVCAVSAIEWRKPLVGNPAPDFKATAVVDQDFKEIRLSDYVGKKCEAAWQGDLSVDQIIYLVALSSLIALAYPNPVCLSPADVVLFFYPLGKSWDGLN